MLTTWNYDTDNEFHFHSDKTFFVSPGFSLATEFAAVDVADPVQLSQSPHRPSSSVSRVGFSSL